MENNQNKEEGEVTATDEQGKIVKLSRMRSLTAYHNSHLHAQIAAEMNIKVLEKKPADEVISQRIRQVPGGGQVLEKLKAGEALESHKKLYADNLELVEVANNLMAVETQMENAKVAEVETQSKLFEDRKD